MKKRIPPPETDDSDDKITPEFTDQMKRAAAIGTGIAPSFADAEDEETLMLALSLLVSKCLLALILREDRAPTASDMKLFLTAQESFLVYFAMSHQNAKDGLLAQSPELAELVRKGGQVVSDVEIN